MVSCVCLELSLQRHFAIHPRQIPHRTAKFPVQMARRSAGSGKLSAAAALVIPVIGVKSGHFPILSQLIFGS